MAWIGMYLLKDDLEFLNDWLNQEDEIAFLISNGYKKWKAVKEFDLWQDLQVNELDYDGNIYSFPQFYRQYLLWHVTGGSLPLLKPIEGGVKLFDDTPEEIIDNPWAGWTETRTGADPFRPYFGAGCPATISLDLNLNSETEIPLSHFGWIGNRYKLIGSPAEETTEKFWKRLRKMISKVSTKVSRQNSNDYKPEIYAFPNAYKAIQKGQPCSLT